MNMDITLRRASVYGFLAEVFLYPADDWMPDLPALGAALHELGLDPASLAGPALGLDALQAAHRQTFSMVGSLCYETEYGLPHEFRQSQELADIAGFYRAFGFAVGGPVRERPDHLAAELEFMYVLALKEAAAAQRGSAEHLEICADAQRQFLQDHLAQWVGLFAERVEQSGASWPYGPLARQTADFVRADAERLGAQIRRRRLAEVRPTPPGPELSCEGCAVAELWE